MGLGEAVQKILKFSAWPPLRILSNRRRVGHIKQNGQTGAEREQRSGI